MTGLADPSVPTLTATWVSPPPLSDVTVPWLVVTDPTTNTVIAWGVSENVVVVPSLPVRISVTV